MVVSCCASASSSSCLQEKIGSQLSSICKTRLSPSDNFTFCTSPQCPLKSLMITPLASGYRYEIVCLFLVICLKQKYFFVCLGILCFTFYKQGWWILPCNNTLSVGAITVYVQWHCLLMVFGRTLWKSLLLLCFCLRLPFRFFSPQCTIETSAWLFSKQKLMTLILNIAFNT